MAGSEEPAPGEERAVAAAYDPSRMPSTGAPRVMWASALILGIGAVLLIPWTVYLAWTLPGRAVAENYDVAWTGFDIGLILVLAGTAVAALRGGRWLPTLAAVTAATLLIDAWFDVVTASTTADRVEAVVLAAVVEVPVACACLWIAVNAQEFNDRRVARAARRTSRRAA
ncbi:hypothetical protein [Flexivirga alba]|uniref:Uncharacterized protein n=1 Tax=Flexivirga alba TaxID=702742 RepID=A0ABW2ACR9_9MICO